MLQCYLPSILSSAERLAHQIGESARMKVKLMVYGFKSWLGPIGMNTIVDTIEGEVTQEALAEIKKKIDQKKPST